MRVLHVITSLDPATGGPPTVVTRLAAAQAALGAQAEIISYQSTRAQKDIELSLAGIPGIAAVKRHELPPPTRSERLLARNARKSLRRIVQDADILHLHGVWDPIVRSAAGSALAAGKPYVVRPCGMLDPWSLSQKHWKKSLALAAGYRRMLDGAAFIHFLNDEERRLAAPIGLKSPARVLPNGVFMEELMPPPPDRAFRAAHPELQDQPFVLFLSRLHHKKGLDYLADAFALVCAKMAEPLLVVAGPDKGARVDFENQVRQLGIARRVHLVGPLFGQAKLAALRECAVFCLPSRQEGFSLAILEAMASAAPVVISSQCHFSEASAAGHVVELSTNPIASALLDLLQNPALARQRGEAGRAMVEAKYTWPNIAAEVLDAYRQTAGSQVHAIS